MQMVGFFQLVSFWCLGFTNAKNQIQMNLIWLISASYPYMTTSFRFHFKVFDEESSIYVIYFRACTAADERIYDLMSIAGVRRLELSIAVSATFLSYTL